MCCSIIPGTTSSDITIDNKTSSMKNGETTTMTEPSLRTSCKNNFIASTLFYADAMVIFTSIGITIVIVIIVIIAGVSITVYFKKISQQHRIESKRK